MEILADLADDGVPAEFKYFSVAKATIGGQPVILSRTGWTNEMGFEIYTLPNGGKFDGVAMWESFLKAGKPHGMEVCALDSMDIRRIEGGILNNGSDMDETMTPFEAGLGAFVDLTADFIGKDALSQKSTSARVIGLKCPEGEPLRLGPVSIGERKVGYVTAGAWSPFLKCGIAIVRLDAALDAGTAVTVQCRDGKGHSARLDNLPLYDSEKKIPRGMDTEIPTRDAAE